MLTSYVSVGMPTIALEVGDGDLLVRRGKIVLVMKGSTRLFDEASLVTLVERNEHAPLPHRPKYKLTQWYP